MSELVSVIIPTYNCGEFIGEQEPYLSKRILTGK